jgi:hypothetical protein
MPGQLVFGRDMVLNVQHLTDWTAIKTRKHQIIRKNNRIEDSKQIPHHYQVGDLVMLENNRANKYEHPYNGPYCITHLGAQNSGNSLGKILVFSAIFLENFYNFSVANNNVCNLDINNYYSVSTITKPIPIFTIFIFTVTLPNVLHLKSHTSKIVVTAITTLGH